MAKHYSWYEIYNEKTGEVDKYRDPLNPDAFPEEEKEQKKVKSDENTKEEKPD